MTDRKQILLSVFDIKEKKIVRYPIDDYIVRILAFEFSKDAHIEALKAYAIMIRTYIKKKMRLFDNEGCLYHKDADLCNDPKHCIGALPFEEIPEETKKQLSQAVNSTQNKIITFQGKIIQPYYHDTCGGSTENSENILGNTIAYTRRVLCDHCKDTSPHWQTSVEFSLEELERKLKIHFPLLTPTEGINMDKIFNHIERDEYGRVISAKVGEKIIKATELKDILDLNSTRFGWRPTGIRFLAQGKGDGIGLCKQGAQGLAQKGKKAEEILKYYFTGVEIENSGQWSINFPLRGKILLLDAGHGGKEIGLQKDEIVEKEINLDITLILKKLLEEAGVKTVLIRDSDQYVSLNDRLEISNLIKPHFILSIHGNDNRGMGNITQVYGYPGDEDAIELGKCVIEELRNIGLYCWDIIEADLYLLRESKKSALCLDIGYFFINSKKNTQKIAEAIYKGILSYWKINNR